MPLLWIDFLFFPAPTSLPKMRRGSNVLLWMPNGIQGVFFGTYTKAACHVVQVVCNRCSMSRVRLHEHEDDDEEEQEKIKSAADRVRVCDYCQAEMDEKEEAESNESPDTPIMDQLRKQMDRNSTGWARRVNYWFMVQSMMFCSYSTHAMSIIIIIA